MALIIASQKLVGRDESRLSNQTFVQGILTSRYKIVVNSTHNAATKNLFKYRQCIKYEQYQMVSALDTVMKLLLFTTLILILFS